MTVETRNTRASYTIVAKRSIFGAKVINLDQEELGTIEDLVIDASDSHVAYAILSSGGFLGLGDKHFAIPWEALSFDISQKTAVLNIDKHRLTNAPGFHKDKWPDMSDTAWGQEIHAHYGVAPYGDRPRGSDPTS